MGFLLHKLANFKTLVRNPQFAPEYLSYLGKKLRQGDSLTRNFEHGIKISGFRNFSEFLATKNVISKSELRFFEKLKGVNGPIIDIGANRGFFSILFNNLFHGEKIFAFEPSPYTFQLLVNNLKRNNCSDVTAGCLAVGESDGNSKFNCRLHNIDTASFANSKTEDSIDVEVKTLSRIAREYDLEKISILKVDVEGYEFQVFKGASDLFDRKVIDLVFFEVCPGNVKPGSHAEDAPNFLLGKGYQLFRIRDDAALMPVKAEEAKFVSLENWVATPSSLRQSLGL